MTVFLVVAALVVGMFIGGAAGAIIIGASAAGRHEEDCAACIRLGHIKPQDRPWRHE